MTTSHQRRITLGLLFQVLVYPTANAWLPSSRPIHRLVATMATRDILPVDRFGDFKANDDPAGLSYYQGDDAQTIFPFLTEWQIQPQDGSLVGIVYNHPRFQDGEAIATSPLDEECSDLPSVEGVVTTTTGSQYLLGEELVVELKEWRVTADGCLHGIVGRAYPQVQLSAGQKITTSPTMDPVEEGTVITTENGYHYQLLQPKSFPLLEQWKRLEGGSIAGFVHHHPKIPNGELITTTPLVELDESQPGLILVTTASGSQYRLGEAEPVKGQHSLEDEATGEEEETGVFYDDGIYYGEDDAEEEAVSGIPTHLRPKINPVEHILAAAFSLHQKSVDRYHKYYSKSEDSFRLKDIIESNNPSSEVQNVTEWANRTAWGH